MGESVIASGNLTILPYVEKAENILNDIGSTIGDNLGTIAIGTGSAVVGAGLGALAVSKSTKKRKAKSKSKSRKKKTSSSRSRGRKLKFGSKAFRKKYLSHRRRKQKQPHTAGKRKDTSHRRIRYTKNNQPYVILSSGKARFIKKSTVSRARKLKGGMY